MYQFIKFISYRHSKLKIKIYIMAHDGYTTLNRNNISDRLEPDDIKWVDFRIFYAFVAGILISIAKESKRIDFSS